MDEKKIAISRKYFSEAVANTVKKLSENEELKGMAAVMIPMIGMKFASDLEEILFGEEQETETPTKAEDSLN